jgi:hypothetical protein
MTRTTPCRSAFRRDLGSSRLNLSPRRRGAAPTILSSPNALGSKAPGAPDANRVFA